MRAPTPPLLGRAAATEGWTDGRHAALQQELLGHRRAPACSKRPFQLVQTNMFPWEDTMATGHPWLLPRTATCEAPVVRGVMRRGVVLRGDRVSHKAGARPRNAGGPFAGRLQWSISKPFYCQLAPLVSPSVVRLLLSLKPVRWLGYVRPWCLT
jgi:hypothetical protein